MHLFSFRAGRHGINTVRPFFFFHRHHHHHHYYSTWFRRILSPKEETELYLGITSSFRAQLAKQSAHNKTSYNTIIEQSIYNKSRIDKPHGSLSFEEIKQLHLDLDHASKTKDLDALQQLEKRMKDALVCHVTAHNRLLRGYLRCKAMDKAEAVLEKMHTRHLFPSTRTFIYLIQAHTRQGTMDKAQGYVDRMEHFGLNRLWTPFDYSVMLQFHSRKGDTHAIEYLWRAMVAQPQTMKPTLLLHLQYMAYFEGAGWVEMVAKVAQEALSCDKVMLTYETERVKYEGILVKSATALIPNCTHTPLAADLLLLLLAILPSPNTTTSSSHSNSSHSNSHSSSLHSCLTLLVETYIDRGHELKALQFYYSTTHYLHSSYPMPPSLNALLHQQSLGEAQEGLVQLP
ncbi:hypothetical protein BDF14DRAFT_1742746 [Spinellus fusiger]|nr:hypothetical protein BDF14DRAFT_1742746 [Spinellus fusiger]